MDEEAHRSLRGAEISVRIEAMGARMTSIRHIATSIELLAPQVNTTANSEGPAEADWHRRFAAGWNVLIPNAGDARTVDGVTHDYHGEAARRMWHLSGSEGVVTATLTLRSVPLTLTRVVSVADSGLTVVQQIRNDSELPQRFAWVEHPVFNGALFSGARGVRLDSTFVPFAPLGHGRFDSARVPSGHVGVDLADAPLSLSLAWDPHVLPHMHVWQERRSVAGPPWFGRVDGVGLEPASHGPGNPETGLGPLVLGPSGFLESSLRLEVVEEE